MSGGDGRLLAALPLLLAAAEVALCNSEAINCTPCKGIKGEDITLTPIFTGNLSEIIWKKEVNKQFDKVAEWEGTLKLYSRLVNRGGIDPDSGKLTIKNISQLDDGKYKAEPRVGQYYQEATYLCLKTLEPPSAPNLTCNIDADGIYVHCTSVTGYELPLQLHWNYINMNGISIVNSTEEHSSVKLQKNTDLSRNITCIIVASKSYVSNTISLTACDSKGIYKRPRGLYVVEGNPENQSSISEDAAKSHQVEKSPFLGGPENETSREVHPENHNNESGPSDEPSEPEHKTSPSPTTSREGEEAVWEAGVSLYKSSWIPDTPLTFPSPTP
ncbi:hypothetical protein lerEdw1_020576 [Lerista edwardsae]|nr:hypothetical protein lerEdw1_020576 [Lerista edwardsae]